KVLCVDLVHAAGDVVLGAVLLVGEFRVPSAGFAVQVLGKIAHYRVVDSYAHRFPSCSLAACRRLSASTMSHVSRGRVGAAKLPSASKRAAYSGSSDVNSASMRLRIARASRTSRRAMLGYRAALASLICASSARSVTARSKPFCPCSM